MAKDKEKTHKTLASWLTEIKERRQKGHTLITADVPGMTPEAFPRIGFKDQEDGSHHTVEISGIKAEMTALDPSLRDLFKTAGGRRKMLEITPKE